MYSCINVYSSCINVYSSWISSSKLHVLLLLQKRNEDIFLLVVLLSKFWIKMNPTVKDPLLLLESLDWSIFAGL